MYVDKITVGNSEMRILPLVQQEAASAQTERGVQGFAPLSVAAVEAAVLVGDPE